jgi:hypothetical protein
VNGVKRLVTLDELRQGYEKATGADERFNQAAAIRQEASSGIRIQDAITTMRNESLDVNARVAAAREIATMLGTTPQEFDALVAQARTETGAASPAPAPAAAPRKLSTEDLPEDVQEVMREVNAQKLARRREEIFTSTDNAVAKDEILGKMDTDVRDTLTRMARNEVQRRVVALGQTFSPDLLKEVVQELRGFSKMIGKPTAAKPEDDAVSAELARMGLVNLGGAGGTPAVSDTAALQAGQAATPGASGDPSKPNRLSVNDPNWSKDFMSKVSDHMRRLLTPGQTSALRR